MRLFPDYHPPRLMVEITAASIRAAHGRVSPSLTDTPVIHSRTLSDLTGCTALFKLENLQMTGSFKERGALNRLLALSEEERARGVIAASAGNHAQALAYHAQRLGISARIVMPERSPLVKVRSTEHWGAEVILTGDTFDDAYAASQAIVEEENRVYIHPFDDPLVVEGQGTLAVDILAHPLCESLDAVLIPVGGGGLIAGVATYLKEVRPEIRVIGVEESTCDAMYQGMNAGKAVTLPPAPIIADGIAVRQVSSNNLQTVSKLVDEIVSVDSDEIANAIMLMLEIEKMVVEGSAAVTLAALVNQRLPMLAGKRVLSVMSGGNIDVNLLNRIINRGLSFDGRIARFDSAVLDRPGALETMLGIFRESGANVLEVTHHRFSGEAPIGQIGVSITVETRDASHVAVISDTLKAHGYPLKTSTPHVT